MTWPTDRPGYPRDAERDGWHWLQVSDWPPHAEEWSAARREWKGYHGNKAFDVREGMRALIRYLGPCYTQADLDAAVQAALAQARREVWEKAREVARNVHPSAASATGEAHMRSYRDAIVHAISAAAGEDGK